jgi:DNA-binding transcriptional LysR family regulator
MIQRLLEGTLDLAVMYQPGQPPGFTIEHLFDEELVLVTSAPGRRRHHSDYVFVDWGPDFQADHAAAYPELSNAGVNLDLGSMGIDYLLANEASGYFPRRLVKHHLTRRRLRIPARSRSFTSAVYMVYPESRDEEAFEPILQGLRRAAERMI